MLRLCVRVGRSAPHVTQIRYASSGMSSADKERETFSIFSQISKSKQKNKVEEIVDEIMTLSIRELSELTVALNDPEVVKTCGASGDHNMFPDQSTIPLGRNRSPFPHPKHLFAGVDADQRPGMHIVPQK